MDANLTGPLPADDLDMDLERAIEALARASDGLADAWAALRHARWEPERLRRLVDCLTLVRMIRREALHEREENLPKQGFDPDEWFLWN